MEEIKSITIIKHKQGFEVRQGDRIADLLGWDEMLGVVATLTMPNEQYARTDVWMKQTMTIPVENAAQILGVSVGVLECMAKDKTIHSCNDFHGNISFFERDIENFKSRYSVRQIGDNGYIISAKDVLPF